MEHLGVGRAIIFGVASMLDFTGTLWFRRSASTAELDMACAWHEISGLHSPAAREDGKQVAVEDHLPKSDIPRDSSLAPSTPGGGRSHWDMLLEHYSRLDIQRILHERLMIIRKQREEERAEDDRETDRRNTA